MSTDDIAHFREFYYEARLTAGFEGPVAPDPNIAPVAGLGWTLRLGSGPAQAVASGWGGSRPYLDLRAQYAGYSTMGPLGVRMASGVVASRDAGRGEPEWLVGLCADLDLGLSKRWELFFTASLRDRFANPWVPGHATATIGDGVRWIPGNFGLEFGGTVHYLYEDESQFIAHISVFGRVSITAEEPLLTAAPTARPTTPLSPGWPSSRR